MKNTKNQTKMRNSIKEKPRKVEKKVQRQEKLIQTLRKCRLLSDDEEDDFLTF